MSFEDFLRSKLIDSVAFEKALSDMFQQFRNEFELGGAEAFDQRKKFYLNSLRLEFPFTGEAKEE